VKAVVIHHSINTSGGETTLAIETIQALHELGYNIELVTAQKPNLENIAKLYGKKIPISNIKSLLPFKINYFGVYQRLLISILPLSLKDSDIVINTNGIPLHYAIPNNVPSMVYIPFPPFLIGSEGYNNTKYQKSLFWKLYFKPYRIMASKITKATLTKSNAVLTISKFSRDALRKACPEVEPYVLYPPVDIERFSIAYRSISRERKVLVISRFSPEKQIEKAIKIARLLRGNIKFEVIGSLIPANRSYFDSLQKMIQDYRLEGIIRLIPNATNVELLDAMSTCTLYLHTMYGDHFGVSVVEAMAAGLVPIVPCYGGSSEIVPLEYQYNILEEALDRILKNIDEYNSDKREKMYNIAKHYSQPRFREMLQQCIELACISSGHNNINKIKK
jgi:glycosyltransferase involved in cell wall biosynthesis